MDVRTENEAGKLTLVDAAELSRLLMERMASFANDDEGDLMADLVAPLLRQVAGTLTPPGEHLAAIRAKLAKVAAR